MKVWVDKKDTAGQVLLTFEPESDDDKVALRGLIEAWSRPNMIVCRGARYLEQNVEFLVQPMPRGD